MITIGEVAWDETKDVDEQSAECIAWVQENLLNNNPVTEFEEVERKNKKTLRRVKKQTYSNGSFSLEFDRTYPSEENCKAPKVRSKLTVL